MLNRLFIFFLAIFLLTGCSIKDKQEVLTFSSWGSISEVEILSQIIDNFEDDNPNVKINFLHVPQNYFQKLHLLFASNQAPDVVFINNLYLPLYANKLEDLSNFEDLDAYYDESLRALSYDNKLLAIPRDISNLVFYRNKKLITSVPNNLDEFIDVISKSKNFGVSFERDVYFMFPYVLTFGEDIYKPNKSLEFYKGLEGKYAPKPSEVGSSTLAQMFLDEKIGLYMAGRWMYPKISETANFEWDVITFPGIVPLDSSGWAISKDSNKKDLAKKFVKYLASEKSSKYFLDTGLIVPARISVAKQIDNKTFLDSIKKSRVLFIDKDYKKKTDEMNELFFID